MSDVQFDVPRQTLSPDRTSPAFDLYVNPRRAWECLDTPSSGFSHISQKQRHWAPPFFFGTLASTFFPQMWKFQTFNSPQTLQVRSSGHVKWPHLRKVWILVIATPNDRSPWSFHRLISVALSIKYVSRNFDIGHPRSGQLCDVFIICKLFGENWKAPHLEAPEAFLLWLLTLFRTPPIPYRYVAQEPS